MDDLTYTFEDAEDAGTYLREVGLFWAFWVIGLTGLFLTNAIALIGWAVGILAVLIWLARPIQRRAEKVISGDKVEGDNTNVTLRGGYVRDRAMRDLAYGTEPLRVALRMVGRSERWLLLRHVVLALTLISVMYTIANPGI